MTILNVYLYHQKVGELTSDWTFQYTPDWLTYPRAIPLSISLPLRREPYDKQSVQPFFSNLLPEANVRTALVRKLGISLGNDFKLLTAIGGECAGAVSLLLDDTNVDRDKIAYYQLSGQELQERIQSLPTNPLLAGFTDARLSLAGAQHKLPLYYEKHQFFVPLHGSPSNYIIKPPLVDFPGSVENELFCMRLAKCIELNVPEVMAFLHPCKFYMIERYDRKRADNGQLIRIHQEDFCQALGIMPEQKYESEGGPGLEQCFSLIQKYSLNPIIDIRQLLEWVIFNYLIGNADAHAKNLSMLLLGDRLLLAPFYDLLSTAIYPELTQKMAMQIGGENRLEWIQKRHWERFSEAIGVKYSFLAKSIAKVMHSVEQLAPIVIKELSQPGFDIAIYQQIFHLIQRQLKRLTRYL